LARKPEGNRSLGRPRSRRDDNIKMIFRKWDVRGWNESSWLRIGTGGNETLDSIKCGEFLDYLQNRLAFEEGLCSME
jgi:hypothetical protein